MHILARVALLAALTASPVLVAPAASAAPNGAGFSECAKLGQEQKRLCKAANGAPTYDVPGESLGIGKLDPADLRVYCEEGDLLVAMAVTATDYTTGAPMPDGTLSVTATQTDADGRSGTISVFNNSGALVLARSSGTCADVTA